MLSSASSVYTLTIYNPKNIEQGSIPNLEKMRRFIECFHLGLDGQVTAWPRNAYDPCHILVLIWMSFER